MGVSFNVQKFEAHSHLRFHHTDDSENLYLLAFEGERSADPGADLQGAARTQKTSSKRKI